MNTPTEPAKQKVIMTIREAAREYAFPEFGLRGLIKTGAFPVIRCGTRCYITRKVLEAYIESGGEYYKPVR
ncbi:MAG: helix-turn-helix domain-containing protein [Oscillospiraceae bacterium]|jgi:hypothetical protein|nr:helix-turn-helix domain-containing protein [Oscillospiraceae bacterium]